MGDVAVEESQGVSDIAPDATPLLSVDGLRIAFGGVDVVRDASFTVRRGETLGLVGESGSGKTVTSMATIGLLPALGGRVVEGSIRFDEQEVGGLSEKEWLRIRGRRIGMIFQEPTRSLDPAFTVGDQISETLRAHTKIGRKDARRRAVELLESVGIADAARRAGDYPHMFSGGMCQRVMIAIALSCGPDLLIADEPTTALDVTLQAKFLELLRDLREQHNLSILYITHDLGVVAELCDRVAVMYAGEVVEVADTHDLFWTPTHPYTQGLLDSIPQPGTGDKRMVAIAGRVPPPTEMPDGCRFHPRCPYASLPACASSELELVEAVPGHPSRCLFAGRLDLPGIQAR